MEVQHTPAAVVAASGGMVLQQHIEDNQERAISMMYTHLQTELLLLLVVFLTYSVCKHAKISIFIVRFVVGERG